MVVSVVGGNSAGADLFLAAGDAAAGDQFPGCATDGLGSGGPGPGAGDRAAAGLLRSEHVQRFFPVGGNDFRARFKFSP